MRVVSLCVVCFNGVICVVYKVCAGRIVCLCICLHVYLLCEQIAYVCIPPCASEWCVFTLHVESVCVCVVCVMYVYACMYMAWCVRHMNVHVCTYVWYIEGY